MYSTVKYQYLKDLKKKERRKKIFRANIAI